MAMQSILTSADADCVQEHTQNTLFLPQAKQVERQSPGALRRAARARRSAARCEEQRFFSRNALKHEEEAAEGRDRSSFISPTEAVTEEKASFQKQQL